METLKKLDGIAEKWSKAKPVSSHAKNYELIWDRIKDLNTQSEDHNGVMRPAYATCHRNFHNTKKLETNSKQKTSEIDVQNSKVLIILMMTGPIQKNHCQLWRETVEQILFTRSASSLKKMSYIILNTVH